MQLDRWQDSEFVVPDEIVGVRQGEPDRLAYRLQVLRGDARLGAHVPERLAAESGETIELCVVDEVERQMAAADGPAHPIERHPCGLEALDEPNPADVSEREGVAFSGRQDAEFDEPINVVGVNPRPIGKLLLPVSSTAQR